MTPWPARILLEIVGFFGYVWHDILGLEFDMVDFCRVVMVFAIAALFCAGVKGDDPSARARSAWAWAVAKHEPTKACPDCQGTGMLDRGTLDARECPKCQGAGKWTWETKVKHDAATPSTPCGKPDCACGCKEGKACSCGAPVKAEAATLESTLRELHDTHERDGTFQYTNPPCAIKTAAYGQIITFIIGGKRFIIHGDKATLASAGAAKVDSPEVDPSVITLELIVPNTSKVWLEGVEQWGVGNTRTFVSPPLKAGTYTYTIKVRDVYGNEETRKVECTTGQTRVVEFAAEQPTREDRLPPMQFRGQFPGPLLRMRGEDCGPTG